MRPAASIAALHQYIEVAPSTDLIAWGSDTWTSEEATGALLAWQHVVATVLAEKVGLKAQGLGKLTDLFMATWMGKAGLLIIAFFVCVAVYAELFVEYDKYVHFANAFAASILIGIFVALLR